MIEVSLFAGADKSFGSSFQIVPAQTDGLGFSSADGAVAGGSGDGFQKIGKLLDDGIGGWADVAEALVRELGIPDKKSAGLLAKPLDNADITGEPDQLRGAVERVFTAAALTFLLGRLGPFIDQGEGDAEFTGNFLGTGFFEGFSEDFVRFHISTYRESIRIGKRRIHPVDWFFQIRHSGHP